MRDKTNSKLKSDRPTYLVNIDTIVCTFMKKDPSQRMLLRLVKKCYGKRVRLNVLS